MKSLLRTLLCSAIVFSMESPLTAQEFILRNEAAKSVIANAEEIRVSGPDKLPREIKFQNLPSSDINTFLAKNVSVFHLSENSSFKEISKFEDHLGFIHHKFQEYYSNIPVEGHLFYFHEKDDKVKLANGYTSGRLNLNTTPSITEKEALTIATKTIGAKKYKWETKSNEEVNISGIEDRSAAYFPKGVLLIAYNSENNSYSLCYKFDIYSDLPFGRNYVYVNAETGEVFKIVNRIQTGDESGKGETLYNGTVNITTEKSGANYRLRETGRKNGIQTFDLKNSTSYSSAVDFTDSDNNFTDSNAKAGVSAHFAVEATYDYYKSKFNRNSLDDKGYLVKSFVHFYTDYNNAFYDGDVLTFGDGDGVTYSPLVSLDIVAHEYTHGVTAYTANLEYMNESGALNESFSDILGTSVEFYVKGVNGNWDEGEDVFINGGKVRSLSDPNLKNDPDTYKGSFWVNPDGEDNGGVHTNSGVQNFWFYLLSVGGSGTNDNGNTYKVAGIGIEKAAAIAYRNLTVYLGQYSGFHEARSGAENSAIDLFGNGSAEHLAVKDAWSAVGVYEPRPIINISASMLEFGSVVLGGTKTMEFKIGSIGTDPLSVLSIKSDKKVFSLSDSSFILPGGNTKTVKVTFTPDTLDIISALLTIESNDTSKPMISITLTGTGQNAPLVKLSPSSLSFNVTTGNTEITQLTIQNEGAGNLIWALGAPSDELRSSKNSLWKPKTKEMLQKLSEKNRGNYPSDQNQKNNMIFKTEIPQFTSGSTGKLYAAANGFVYSLDTETGEVISQIAVEYSFFGPQGLAYDGKNVFYTDCYMSNKVFVIDGELTAIIDSLDFNFGGSVEGLASDGTNLYAEDYANDVIYTIDLESELITGEFSFSPGSFGGLAYSLKRKSLFVSSDSNYIYELDIVSGQRLDSIYTSATIYSLGFSNSTGKLYLSGPGGSLTFNPETREFSAFSPNIFSGLAGDEVTALGSFTYTPQKGVITPKNNETVEITFNPESLFGGIYNFDLQLFTNDPFSTEKNIPVQATVTGAPLINVSADSILFSSIFFGDSTLTPLVIKNTGTDELIIHSIVSDQPAFSPDTSGFSLAPGVALKIFICFLPDVTGLFIGNLKITSNDKFHPEVNIYLAGNSLPPPDISLNPTEFEFTVNSGQSVETSLSISNPGENDLEWKLIPDFTSGGTVAARSPVFKNRGIADPKLHSPDRDQIQNPNGEHLFRFDQIQLTEFSNRTGKSKPDIELAQVLANLDKNHAEITKTIPERYNFSEGETGNHIKNGGNNMYNNGNYLSTNDFYQFNYTNGIITSGFEFGAGGKFFTKKYPGLFVLAADMNGISYFSINGNIGGGLDGHVGGSILKTKFDGKNYLGFVKRNYYGGIPSVNHIIIIEENGKATHQFDTNPKYDGHWITGLENVKRIYYLLYAGDKGAQIKDPEALQIMNAFLSNGIGYSNWLTANPDSGVNAASSTSLSTITANSTGMNAGTYHATISVSSNVPGKGSLSLPFTMNVMGTSNILVTPDTLNFGDLYINDPDSLNLTLYSTGTQNLRVDSLVFSNSDFSTVAKTEVINSGDSETVAVRCYPSKLGLNYGMLTIFSNSANNPVLSVVLTGNTIEPPVMDISPDSLTFAINTGDSSYQTITISNKGKSNLIWSLNNFISDQKKNYTLADFETTFSNEKLVDSQNTVSGPLTSKVGHFSGEFSDLTGDTIGYIGEFSNILKQDLQQRGALILHLWESLSSKSLNKFDVIIIDDYLSNIGWENIETIREYIRKGGSLIFQADDYTTPHYARALFEGTGIDFFTYGTKFNGVLTNIVSHQITKNVKILSEYEYGGFFIIRGSAKPLIYDDFSNIHAATANYGLGNIMVIGNECISDYAINEYDNRLFCNQLIDWAAYSANKRILMNLIPDHGIVSPGDFSDLTVIFKTEKIMGGEYNNEIVVKSNDPKLKEKEIPVRLKIVGIPEIVLNQDSFLFDTTFTNNSTSINLIVTNYGTDILHITGISSGKNEFKINKTSAEIAIEAVDTFKVYFTPLNPGIFQTDLTLLTDDPQKPVLKVLLSAFAIDPPKISVSEKSLNYFVNIGDSVNSTFSICNFGKSDLKWVVNFEESISFKKAFKSNHDFKNSRLFPEIPEQISSFENKISAVSGFSKAKIPFKDGFEDNDLSDWLTLNESGIWGITSTSAVNGIFSFHDKATSSSNYKGIIREFESETKPEYISWYAKTSQSFGGYSGLFNVLDENGVILFNALFNTDGTIGCNFNSTSVYYDPFKWYHFEFKNIDWVNFKFDFYINDVLIAEKVSFYSFNSNLNGISKIFLANFSPNIESCWDEIIVLQKEKPDWLLVSPSIGSLSASAKQDISILIKTKNLLAGKYSGNILVESNDPDESVIKIPVELTVKGIPKIEIDVDSLNFGSIFLGDTTSKKIVIKNRGSDSLKVEIEAISLPEFSVNKFNSLIPINSKDSIVIKFIPTRISVFNESIKIKSNTPGNPVINFSLKGTSVTPPVLDYEIDSANFAIEYNDSTEYHFKIKNKGNHKLSWVMGLRYIETNSGFSRESAENSQVEPLKKVKSITDDLAENNLMKVNKVNEEFAFLKLKDSPVALTCMTSDPTTGFIYAQEFNGNRFFRYDPESNLWTGMKDSPFSSGNHGGAVFLQGKIYIAYAEVSSFINVYTIAENSWSYLNIESILPSGNIASDGNILFKTKGYLFNWYSTIGSKGSLPSPPIPFSNQGGLQFSDGNVYGHTGDGSTAFLKYSVSTEHWDILPDLPAGAILGSAFDPVDKSYYAYGSHRGNYIYRYNTATKTWAMTTIPFFSIDNGGLVYVSKKGYEGIYFCQGEIGIGFAKVKVKQVFNWAKLSVWSGIIPSQDSVSVTLSINSRGLDIGTFNSILTLQTDDPKNKKVNIPLQLSVVRKTGVSDNISNIPESFVLHQNYPNPFNPSTTIKYDLPIAARVQIKVYSMLGQEITTLANENQTPGFKQITWNGSNSSGQQVTTGVYLLRIQADDFVSVRKMILLK